MLTMKQFQTLISLAVMLVFALAARVKANETFELTLRSRILHSGDDDSSEPIVDAEETWKASETAVIVCDMWDLHHCLNATRRVKEMAPSMNRFLKVARKRGALIVHAPSSCMDAYSDHPARKRAQSVPTASNLPPDIGAWCHWKNGREKKVGYPIDHTDGGEDDDPREHAKWAKRLSDMGRDPKAPWKSQISLLEIDAERDVISDSGVEIWNLFDDRGIENVMLVGVHTNMCVLGRPFGLRQMARNGKNVVLVRDMTDAMYNPRRRPYVSHFRGTELVVEHIERFVCPTITSDQVTGESPFQFKNDVRPHVVIAISEPEYKTDITLPRFAKRCWAGKHGYPITILKGDPSEHTIPGFAAAIKSADALVLSIRRQALPTTDIAALKAYLLQGKPLIAIRTSNHAFHSRGAGPAHHVQWQEFDAEVLGGNYHGHHGSKFITEVRVADDASHPILFGIDSFKTSRASLYKVSPLAQSTTKLLIGTIADQPAEPLAWTNVFGPKKARVFYTSLGHETDFEKTLLPQLLENAMRWALNQPSPALAVNQ